MRQGILTKPIINFQDNRKTQVQWIKVIDWVIERCGNTESVRNREGFEGKLAVKKSAPVKTLIGEEQR